MSALQTLHQQAIALTEQLAAGAAQADAMRQQIQAMIAREPTTETTQRPKPPEFYGEET